jgi:arylsulfatase
MFGNRGIWTAGWKAEVAHNPRPWEIFADRPFERDVWELYNTDKDFNELHDLAKSNPKKLEEMKQLFDAEAKRNNVYPLRPSPDAMTQTIVVRDRLKANKGHFEYAGDTVGRIPALLAPPVLNRSYTITAEIEPATAAANGVIVAEGGGDAGYSLYLKNGVPVFCYNYFDEEYSFVRGADPLPPGKATLRFVFTRTGNNTGKGTLFVNDRQVGEGEIPHTVPARHSVTETFDIGRDEGSQVSTEYQGLSRFPGKVGKVVFDVSTQN